MRIMTSNIWGDYFGNECSTRRNGLEVTYRKYSPDILGIQEATEGWYNDALFANLSDEYAIVEGRKGDFTPLFYKKSMFELKECGWELLENTPDLSKSITYAVLKCKSSEKRICVLNTHFWWMKRPGDDEIRAENAKQLLNKMNELREKHKCLVFAFGDLNCTLGSPAINYMYENGVCSCFDLAEEYSEVCSLHGDPQRGEDGLFYGKKTPKKKECSIDHILTYKDTKVKTHAVVEDEPVLNSTDHSPVYIDFDLV